MNPAYESAKRYRRVEMCVVALLMVLICAVSFAAPAQPVAYPVEAIRYEGDAKITAHGWAFYSGGRWVTAAHVVESGSIEILNGDERHAATIERKCLASDVAILRSALVGRAIPLRALDASKQVLSFQVQPVRNGESGSPLMVGGECVGMVRSYEPDSERGTCVGAGEIRKLLEAGK